MNSRNAPPDALSYDDDVAWECPIDRAAQRVQEAVDDFRVAIAEARTVTDALKLHVVLSELVVKLSAADDAALEKAGDVNP